MRLALLLAIAACTPNVARDQAISRANAARAQGDYTGEAIALREACNFAPDEKDLCKRAETAWIAAQQRSRDSAKKACTDIAPTVATCANIYLAVTAHHPANGDTCARNGRSHHQP
jgi:hypothetical protein